MIHVHRLYLHRYTKNSRWSFQKRLERWKTSEINIIPSTMGVAKEVGLILPPLKVKLTGMFWSSINHFAHESTFQLKYLSDE